MLPPINHYRAEIDAIKGVDASMKQTEPFTTNDGRAVHGADAILAKATGRIRAKTPKAAKLAHRLRVPPEQAWAARLARQFREHVVSEVCQRRDGGELTSFDWAIVNSIFDAASGLALAYSFLGRRGWIDENEGAFHPVVETVFKLQKVMIDGFGRLGLDKRAEPKDVWVAAIQLAASQPSSNEADSTGVQSQERTGGDSGTPGGEVDRDAAWAPVDSAGELRDK